MASLKFICATYFNTYGLNELRVFGGAPGVGGVPEPASWALLVAGFGIVGAIMRRRRGVALVAA